MNKIIFEDVSKKFFDTEILTHENFALKEGLTFMVGKNGAGKTTFINMSVGLEQITEGVVKLLGHPVKSINIDNKKKIGLQMQNDAFLRNVKVGEYIKLYESLYSGKETFGIEKKVDVEKVFEILEIDTLLSRYAYTLSGGEKKKVSLYLTIIGNKELIILDEPTAGIDVQTKDKIVSVIMYLRKCGIDILVSSHDLEEFYSIADNILMLDRGIVFDGTKTNFDKEFGYKYRVCSEEIPENCEILVGKLFEKNYLYSKDKQVLEKYFPKENIERTTVKDFYQIALLKKKGLEIHENI